MNVHLPKYILIGAISGVIGVFIGALGVGYIYQMKVVQSQPQETVRQETIQPKEQQAEEPKIEAPAAIRWLAVPEKIDKLALMEDKEIEEEYGTTYYKTGTIGSVDIIIARTVEPCPGDCSTYTFFEDRPEGYVLIAKASSSGLFSEDDSNWTGPKLSASVLSFDREKGYDDLRVPLEFTYKGETFKTYDGIGSIPEDGFYEKFMTKIEEMPFGALYSRSEIIESLPGVAAQQYYVRKANGMAVLYDAIPEILSDDFVLKATWKNGKKNTEGYQQISTGGCGTGGGAPVLEQRFVDGLVKTGITPLGPVYEFKDPSTPALKAVYEVVKTSSEDPMPYKKWLTKHPVVAFKDLLGRALLYNNTEYGPQAECGKPVIYLYPTRPTNVTVRVGADIRISEPPYNNGWTAYARPDGGLTVQGKRYDSLYWEGLGSGPYPKIKAGFIVLQNDLEATLRRHLKELGLNQKEAEDFLGFWLPKMPNTPYVRLTWLGTREMNALAPLIVMPRPDTAIRIFLDYEGLERPVDIAPQQFSAIPRKGFTLIEWGGLLRK